MDISYLRHKANRIRNSILEMCIRTGGHVASSFSCVEILVTLYHGRVLKFDPKRPDMKERDHFILSKGHGETVLYAVLADLGFFPEDWLVSEYRNGNCLLGGHPDKSIPGVEVTTGSLGHGLGLAAGISLAVNLNGHSNRQYVLLGDAECTEGSVWEAALFAGKNKLNKLVAIIDRNRIGSIDFTENFTSLNPLREKWQAFGWETAECDGHDFSDIKRCLELAENRQSDKPFSIIANTIKGRGVSFMENQPIWHTKSLTNRQEIERAREELKWSCDE